MKGKLLVSSVNKQQHFKIKNCKTAKQLGFQMHTVTQNLLTWNSNPDWSSVNWENKEPKLNSHKVWQQCYLSLACIQIERALAVNEVVSLPLLIINILSPPHQNKTRTVQH